MNNNNNNNNTPGYRAIVPAPPQTTISSRIPISPHNSPQVHPSPQHGISLPPPFGTPPVSPFSHPMSTEYLPPPLLQPLPPMMSNTPPSPRYDRILPKQQTPSTSVFSIPMTPSNANTVMQHHNSVIHPYYQHRVSISGAATGNNGDKQPTTADQRELARKVSHSAIERRRRERINDKIMQLKELIPSCADQDHLHKLNILQSAIEYIQYLQGCVVESRKREGVNLEERTVKRSKFDRYEIPLPKNFNNSESKSKSDSDKSSDKSSSDIDNDDIPVNKTKKKTIDASTNTEAGDKNEEKHEEEAKTLLLLSKSTSKDSTIDNVSNVSEEKISKTKDVEIQTSNINNDIEEGKKEEVQESTPRGGMTVQQLLCN